MIGFTPALNENEEIEEGEVTIIDGQLVQKLLSDQRQSEDNEDSSGQSQ